ncbi:MAG: diguanylate cyclase [Magnetococcales bacterium]|nr:diguanylate cyclase [Magnetococcales bacterium]
MHSSNKPLVLVADDSSSARKLIAGHLATLDCRVVEAEDGKEAVKKFKKELPDLVLMDANMPMVDGYRACQEIKKTPEGKLTPVIMVTANDSPESVDQAFDAGAQEYLTKPVHWPILQHRVRLVIEGKRARDALSEQHARMDSIFNTAADAIIVIDQQGIIESLNRAARVMFGYDKGALYGKNISCLMPEPYHSAHDGYLKQYKKTGNKHIIGVGREADGQRKDGTTFPMELAVSEVRLPGRTLYTGIIRDITERKEAQRLISYQANYDALTDLPNRALFMKKLNAAVDRPIEDDNGFSLIFIDLDRFKWVNDNLGHPAGDTLLQDSSARIKACLDDSDVVARLGGDEFTAIVHHAKTTDQAIKVANKILDALNEAFPLEGKEVYISGSLGISLYPEDASDVEALLKAADEAMYCSKRAGRNGYHLHTGESEMREKKYE